MDARDFRGIGRPAQEELRRRALWLIEQQGLSQAEAAQVVGVQRQTVNIWLKRYREQGEDSVLDGRRVSPRRGKGLLTAAEAGQVKRWIADKTPDQLQLPFALWTSRAVRDLIELRFAKRLGLSTVQLYLQRWGMTPQKPFGARQGAPARGDRGLARDHLSRDRQTGQGRGGGDLLGRRDRDSPIGTRSGAPMHPRAGRRWLRGAPAGRPGAVDLWAVSNRGLVRVVLEAAWNARPIHCLPAAADRGHGQKVVLLVDNLKLHHAAKVTDWATAHAHEIELCYLPAYAPDHNPDEYLNNDLKQQLRRQPQPGSQDELIKSTRAALRAIQRSPVRVKAYFKPPAVRYAA